MAITIGVFDPTLPRIVPASPSGFCGHIESSLKAVRVFFSHRWADVNMFGNAFVSMTGRTTLQEIQQGRTEMVQFKRFIEATDPTGNAPADREAANDLYNALSARTKGLFYSVDAIMVRKFAAVTTPQELDEVRREIMRECDKCISLQRSLQ